MPLRALLSAPAALLVLMGIVLSACTKPTEIPRLASTRERPIERILLDNKLGPGDVRAILHALNEDGSLTAVVKFFDELSDKAIDDLTELLNRWLYQDPRFLAVLRHRFDTHSFATLAPWVAEEARAAKAQDRRNLVFAVLNDARLVKTVERLHRLADPAIRHAWDAVKKASEASYQAIATAGPGAEVTATMLAQDSLSLLSAHRGLTESTLVHFLEREGFDDIYQGLKELRRQQHLRLPPEPPGNLTKEENQRQVEAQAFEGFRAGLERMLRTPLFPNQKVTEQSNQLDLLLHLAEHAHAGDSREFFTAVEKGLPQFVNNYAGIASDTFQEIFSKAFAIRVVRHFSEPQFDRAYWETLFQKPEKDATTSLYKEVLIAWEPVAGKAGKEEMTSYRLTVHLDAFVAARWLYQNLQPVAEQLTGPPGALFSMAIAPKRVDARFAKVGPPITYPEAANLPADIEALLENYVGTNQEPAGRFNYQIIVPTKKAQFSAAWAEAMIAIDRQRVILSGEKIIRLFTEYLTDPKLLRGFSIASWGGESSLLDILNRFLGISSLERFRTIKSALLPEIAATEKAPRSWGGFGKLDAQTESFILAIFKEGSTPRSDPNEIPLEGHVLHMLHSLGAVAEFDDPVKPFPAPFEAYHAVVSVAAAPRKIGWVGDTLASLSQWNAAALTPENTPALPSFFYGLQSRQLSRRLYYLSQLEGMDWARLRFALAPLTEAEPARDTYRFLADVAPHYPSGWVSLFEWVDQHPLPEKFESLTSKEFNFLRDGVEEGDHEILNRILSSTTREEWAKMVRELTHLQREGSLSRLLRLFALVKDERLRELAQLLVAGEKSGEVPALLNLTLDLIQRSLPTTAGLNLR